MKKLIIMAGIPGAGKSYTRERLYQNVAVVDCDELKKSLKNYDPKNPMTTHNQSKILERYEIYKNFKNEISFVYDTTATNTDKIIKMTIEAQQLGYTVIMCYVKISLETALYRNANRPRKVPEAIILDKYSKILTSMKIAKKYVDEFITVEGE